jgi:hypothetical protein
MPFPYADHPPDDDMPPDDDACDCVGCRDGILSQTWMQRLAEALARFEDLTTREQLWRQGAARD